jgi:NAD(P)-dependent dehydrogenase (short-subunit alcohol dehydrogenase family)
VNGIDGLLIATSILSRRSLQDQVAIITGAGRGIGYEVARSLAWLGGYVVIAEIDDRLGRETASLINSEISPNSAVFIHTDIGDEENVNRLARQVIRLYGRVDIVLNNAVIMPVGRFNETSIRTWDVSYRTNLRGAILMARIFLPLMLQQDSGVIAFVSSTNGKYRGVFEIMKSGQVELAHTLNAELENSGIITFTIHPGLVRTPGVETVVSQIAALEGCGMDISDFAQSETVMSAEIAGAAIAAAIALAPRHRGLDITAAHALKEAGIHQNEIDRVQKTTAPKGSQLY